MVILALGKENARATIPHQDRPDTRHLLHLLLVIKIICSRVLKRTNTEGFPNLVVQSESIIQVIVK